MPGQDFNEKRKMDHIKLCTESDVEASDRYTGFEYFHLLPKALPELNWDELDSQVTFLHKDFSCPFLITGMTGGIERGKEINYNLADAAEKLKIPMGVGSQRIALEKKELREIFQLKNSFQDLFLIANLGIAQLDSKNALEKCHEAVSMIEADAIAIHLNVLQELIQSEGDRNFKNKKEVLMQLISKIKVPVIVKEVGVGMDVETALFLSEIGVSAIDVGGKGGTSWAWIESLRNQEAQEFGKCFRDVGIPTAFALQEISQKIKSTPLIATGGIRSGLTAAKAIGLGAKMVGFGLPLFKAALVSQDKVYEQLNSFLKELKIAMMISGCQKLSELSARIEKIPRHSSLRESLGMT